MGECMAVDQEANVYGAEGFISRDPAGSGLTKFLTR